MRTGHLVFAALMRHLPFVAFAQLAGRESLRDIEINRRAQRKHLYRMDFCCKTISGNTLANANGTQPWSVFAELAQHLIGIAFPLYVDDPLGKDFISPVGATVSALDSTTIDRCLSLFAWAPFRATNAANKLHTLIDLRVVQTTLAGRAAPQMDQAALANQVVLRHQGECGKDENPGRKFNLCADRNRQNTTSSGSYAHEILQVLKLNMFETTQIPALLDPVQEPTQPTRLTVQGELFQTLEH